MAKLDDFHSSDSENSSSTRNNKNNTNPNQKNLDTKENDNNNDNKNGTNPVVQAQTLSQQFNHRLLDNQLNNGGSNLIF